MTPTLLSKSDVDAYAETILDPAELTRYHQLVKQREHQETTVKKPSKADVKSLRKSAKRTVAKSAARRSLSSAVIKAESDALQHIRQLEQQVAKSAGGQDAWGLGFLINRERANLDALQRVRKAAVPSMDNFASLDNYMGNPNPAAAGAASSRAAQDRAVAGVQGAPINARRSAPRDALTGFFEGEPETVQSYEVQVKKARAELAKATTPQERERWGYVASRAALMAMHLKGQG